MIIDCLLFLEGAEERVGFGENELAVGHGILKWEEMKAVWLAV